VNVPIVEVFDNVVRPATPRVPGVILILDTVRVEAIFIVPAKSNVVSGALQLIPRFIDDKKKVPGPTVPNVRVDTPCVKRVYDDSWNVLAVKELTLI
jgi:hypothetical protein